uniref:CPBP family intramembrane glutamic endopeptidase n=1 Tax=Streptococcus pluranimalium TaxID=82348 RepID=UPI003F68FFC8
MTIIKKMTYLAACLPLFALFILPDVVMSKPWANQHTYPLYQTMLGCSLVILIVYLAYRLANYWNLIQFNRRFFNWKTLILLGIAYAIATLINQIGTAWLDALGSSASSKHQEMMESLKRMPLIFNFLSMAVLPSMFEELISRGILMKKIFGFGRLKWIGLVVSSLIFRALHGPANLPSWLMYTGPGFLMGYLYLKTDNLAYPIALHFINNVTTIITIYL